MPVAAKTERGFSATLLPEGIEIDGTLRDRVAVDRLVTILQTLRGSLPEHARKADVTPGSPEVPTVAVP